MKGVPGIESRCSPEGSLRRPTFGSLALVGGDVRRRFPLLFCGRHLRLLQKVTKGRRAAPEILKEVTEETEVRMFNREELEERPEFWPL